MANLVAEVPLINTDLRISKAAAVKQLAVISAAAVVEAAVAAALDRRRVVMAHPGSAITEPINSAEVVALADRKTLTDRQQVATVSEEVVVVAAVDPHLAVGLPIPTDLHRAATDSTEEVLADPLTHMDHRHPVVVVSVAETRVHHKTPTALQQVGMGLEAEEVDKADHLILMELLEVDPALGVADDHLVEMNLAAEMLAGPQTLMDHRRREVVVSAAEMLGDPRILMGHHRQEAVDLAEVILEVDLLLAARVAVDRPTRTDHHLVEMDLAEEVEALRTATDHHQPADLLVVMDLEAPVEDLPVATVHLMLAVVPEAMEEAKAVLDLLQVVAV